MSTNVNEFGSQGSAPQTQSTRSVLAAVSKDYKRDYSSCYNMNAILMLQVASFNYNLIPKCAKAHLPCPKDPLHTTYPRIKMASHLPVLSSAARMPLPGATIRLAMSASSFLFSSGRYSTGMVMVRCGSVYNTRKDLKRYKNDPRFVSTGYLEMSEWKVIHYQGILT